MYIAVYYSIIQFEYKTNIIYRPRVIENNEEILLSKLEKFVKQGLEKYVTIFVTFESWGYYHGNTELTGTTLSKFIAHRREMLKLKN